MGNQNTSGILEEEAKDEGRDSSNGEEQMMVQESAAEGEGGKIPSVERLEFEDDTKEFEDDKGCVEGSDETGVETKGSDSREGGSKMSDEEQEQPCNFTITEVMQNQSLECTSHEAESTTTSDSIQQVQNMLLMKETLEVDNHDAEMASVEDLFSEARPRKEDLERDDTEESAQEEQSNSMNTINEAPQIILLESSTPESEHINEYSSSLDHEEKLTIHESAEDEAENECPSHDHEEKPMINESGNGDDTNSTICVDQEIESGDQITEAELKENGDDSLEEDGAKQDENGETERIVLEKALREESEPSPTENGHETEIETAEKYVTELRSSEGIDTAEVETPPISTESESTTSSSPKMLETEANQSNNGAKVELRKSPSFDFGISFDTRSEDSDQTPLLYQDKTARRSLSTCSNLSFQSTTIQKEYAVKPLQFEAAQVEEKTIQMETPPQVKNIQENNSNASPSKGNGRRKTRSSLFTTCICCTAAIS